MDVGKGWMAVGFRLVQRECCEASTSNVVIVMSDIVFVFKSIFSEEFGAGKSETARGGKVPVARRRSLA